MEKLSATDLLAQIEPLQAYVGKKCQHVKTSAWYNITGLHFREHDMVPCFVYETFHRPPVSFARPVGEMLDGRFHFT